MCRSAYRYEMGKFVPNMSADRVAKLRAWHDSASSDLHALGPSDLEYLGLQLHVPQHVFPPTPTSDLLGSQVRAHVRPAHRVLDMGCGAGANALLAAQICEDVVAVDINPAAVEATAVNAQRNGLELRVRCVQSDVFSHVEGDFDAVVIDPPFRWFAPADMLDRAVTDENYETLQRFIAKVGDYLRPEGFVLLFFGSSGDVQFLDGLIDEAGFSTVTVASRTLHVRDEDATYFVRRLTR